MESEIRRQGSFDVLVARGEVDFHFSPRLREQILSSLDQGHNLLVEMSGVTYIDSSGIASLVEGLQHARGKDLDFGLVGVKDSALQVLKLTRLDGVFPIHDSVDDGLNQIVDRKSEALHVKP